MNKTQTKLHCYSITYRGTLPLEEYNAIIKMLYDNNIPYRTSSHISKTRDDAGLPIYYDRIMFYTDRRYFHNDTRKTKILWQELERILENIHNEV